MQSTVQLGAGEQLDDLLRPTINWLSDGTRGNRTIVLSAGLGALDVLIDTQAEITTIDAATWSSLSALGGLRQQWATVDVDSVAPRLNRIRLPKALVEADTVVALIDVRSQPIIRPAYGIALWSQLTSPRHRIGARLTGNRDGLTAEIALARPPDRIICIDQLWRDGPIVAVVSDDLIASEVVALSIRDMRTSRAAKLGGPWEDELIQRATELGLGARGPSQIELSARVDGTFAPAVDSQARECIELAATRAGLTSIHWD